MYLFISMLLDGGTNREKLAVTERQLASPFQEAPKSFLHLCFMSEVYSCIFSFVHQTNGLMNTNTACKSSRSCLPFYFGKVAHRRKEINVW